MTNKQHECHHPASKLKASVHHCECGENILNGHGIRLLDEAERRGMERAAGLMLVDIGVLETKHKYAMRLIKDIHKEAKEIGG